MEKLKTLEACPERYTKGLESVAPEATNLYQILRRGEPSITDLEEIGTILKGLIGKWRDMPGDDGFNRRSQGCIVMGWYERMCLRAQITPVYQRK